MRFAYVCTNFNSSDLTVAAALSFVDRFGYDAQVVVVDNRSEPGELAKIEDLEAEHQQIKLIANQDNIGYFAGLNVGLDWLEKMGLGDAWVFAGNNDLIFGDGIRAALEAKADELCEHCVVAPNIIGANGIRQNPHVVSKLTKTRQLILGLYYRSYAVARVLVLVSNLLGRLARRPDTSLAQQAGEIYAGHGSCFLLTPRFIAEFGRLPVGSFLYYEEFFLAEQLASKGMHVFYEPSIVVLHVGHATMRKLSGRWVWEQSRDAHRAFRRLKPFSWS